MKPLFLSHFLEEGTPAYGGIQGSIILKRTKNIQNGDTSNNMEFTFPNHIGTHIDFPFHFDTKGKRSQDYLPSFWIFNKIGFVECDIKTFPEIIKTLSTDIEILIFKTGFGGKRGDNEYWSSQPVIPADFAKLLKNHFPDLRVFGFDMISLTSKLDRGEGKKAHLAFLIEYDILILEDMKLDAITVQPSKLVILPLQVKDADGVPCCVLAY